MARQILLSLSLLGFFFLIGCFNPKVESPLIDFGGGSHDTSSSEKVSDPAPGVPDDELSQSQRYQRKLATCQRMSEYRKEKNEQLEKKYKDMQKRYEGEIEKLEDIIKDLREENRDLRKR